MYGFISFLTKTELKKNKQTNKHIWQSFDAILQYVSVAETIA